MQHPVPNPQKPRWLFLVFLFFFFFSPSLSTAEGTLLCGSSKEDSSPNFIPNFTAAMKEVSKGVSESKWASHSVISPSPSIFTYAQCYDFLSHNECKACHSKSRTELPRCFPANSASIYLNGCYLRYDIYNFYNEAVDEDRDKVICGHPIYVHKDQNFQREFTKIVHDIVRRVATKAVSDKGFAVEVEAAGVAPVYAMGKCWATLTILNCSKCMSDAVKKVSKCAPNADGRVMNAGCYLRYSAENFFTNDKEDDLNERHEASGIISSGIALTLIALIGVAFAYVRISRRKREKKNSIYLDMSHLNFKYELLEKATNSFDGSRKLGQGGAGSVFKGILPDGTIVAVKRLFFNTRQWADEFFNEVNLISGIQHKNLVKLLGCSIEGPESLLVYEYLPNKSLDQILFSKHTSLHLTWQMRFEIISGTADGLAYLHGGCGEKIIHRDIKASNILLDENLTPKIADFGLARGVSTDKSHVSTGVAGTLGYMAPEYLVRGQLTEKADVYGFGVLVMEIVSGRRSSVFTQGSSSVLLSVWRHYKANKITQSVDPALNGIYSEKEASNVLQIGLLCTQASVALRPSMFEVVEMLSDEECVIPSPEQPPFLNASVLSLGDTTTTYDPMIPATSSSLSNNNSSNGESAAEVSIFYSAESDNMSIHGSDFLSTFQAFKGS
ncbi:cysteine-rich receptor-like protein kinase 1 [Corylus avellana]|uniref:cysteine-rich receptor-like protein kinase 1 n=1 Tax=Corylus avellana TaxID=13451 RepID=UPI002869EDEF|nr:cysteine-rich receptor-like protein kinase 1 [Corylus avellana]